jgi:3-hydroxyacyl-CoA dehydrogenase
VLLAERAAWRFDLPNTTKLPDVSRIAVLGGGPMAMQMVLAALNVGLKVNWGTRDPARLVEGLDQVRQVFVAGVKEGGLTQEAAKARLAQLTTGDSADMVKGADIILHAARGQGDVPAPPDAIRAVAMPGKVEEFGLRFAPPILSSRLVEVVEGPSARPEQIAAGVVLVQRMNEVPVQVRSGGQSAVARLFTALNRAADALIDNGADPYDIDGAMRDSGWSQPVFQHRDTVGLQEVARGVRADGAVNWSGKLVEVGRMGVPEGLGFYIWKDGQAQPDIEVTDLVDEVRPRKNLKPSEIMRLLVGALANEGARMLDEGMVQRASDIDVLAVMGLDMPRDSGGPMMAVSQMGMFAVKTALERFDHPDKAFWTPHPSWAELIKNGRAFMAR